MEYIGNAKTISPNGAAKPRKGVKMTKGQRKAIKRICEDYDFDDIKELREYMRDNYGDLLDLDLWDKTEDGLYDEISKFIG